MSANGRGVATAVLLVALSGVADERLALADLAREAEVCGEAERRYREIFGRTSAQADPPIVLMHKSTFCPSRLTVHTGQTVRWVNVDKRTSHSVWFRDAGRRDSERLFPEEHTDMVIDLPPGEYRYVCAPHWNDGMVATIMVTR